MLRCALLRQPLAAPAFFSFHAPGVIPSAPKGRRAAGAGVTGTQTTAVPRSGGVKRGEGSLPCGPQPPGSWVQPEQALCWGQVLGHLPSPPGKGRRWGWEGKQPDWAGGRDLPLVLTAAVQRLGNGRVLIFTRVQKEVVRGVGVREKKGMNKWWLWDQPDKPLCKYQNKSKELRNNLYSNR